MDNRPVGFLDSGLGGISVLHAALRELPRENFLYYGDTANIPYGDKPAEEIRGLVHGIIERLLGEGCKAVVIACNTATSAAAEQLRAEYSFPIIGMEPALKPASLLPGEGKVAVMATQMTLALPKFRALMDRYGQDAVPIPCPGLMECVEAGELEGERVDALLREHLRPLEGERVKAAVLGCTHYPFLKKAIGRYFGPDVPLIDGSAGAARQLRRRLEESGLLSETGDGRVTFLSSLPGGEEKMKALLALAEKIL